MKRLALAAAVLLALTLTACGQKSYSLASPAANRQSLSLMLDWFPNADHVGIYQALADGGFAQAGLNVHVEIPSDPALPLKLVAEGKVDLAVSYEPEVFLARNQGLPVASVAAIVQRPLTSIVSVGSQHITKVAQLRGKTVGDAGIAYQHAYLTTILAHAGVPVNKVKEVNVGANLVPAMLSGRVNATLGAYWNYEAIQLQQAKKHPNVIRVEQVGVPSYDELVIVARETTIATKETEIRRFVQALARGYESVRRDPAAGVENLIHSSSGLDRKLQLASVKATLSSFFPAGHEPWGWQDQARWNAYGRWMLDNRLITNPNAIPNASTNELLAGVGVG